MKAWRVFDKNRNEQCSEIVFAETRGRAVGLALNTDTFDGYYGFTDLRANRIPEADSCYHGDSYGDWWDEDLRLIMVKHYDWECLEPDLDMCKTCNAKDFCGGYETLMDED